jgi:hypothetical protein
MMGSSEDPSKAEETADNKSEAQPESSADDRRAQKRTETILSEIEDATYKVLRKHEDKKPG